MRYHVNPESGQVSACRAKNRPCPFMAGHEHFKDEESARTAYEAMMEGRAGQPLSWLLSKKGSPLQALESLDGLLTEQRAKRAKHLPERQSNDKNANARFDLINHYTMGGYEYINQVLRGESHNLYGEEIKDSQREAAVGEIEALDAIIAEAPREPKVVYRYATALDGDVKAALERFMAEGSYTEEGFMSTSAYHEYPAFNVLDLDDGKITPRFLMEIATDKGMSLQKWDYVSPGKVQSQEFEVLLPRGMKFAVVGVEWRKRVEWGPLKDLMLQHRAHFNWPQDFWKKMQKPHASMPVLKLVEVEV